MKSVLLPGQIMFYLRICNFQAQLGTRDIQKFDFKKVLFTSKKLKFMILDRLPKQPTIPYRAFSMDLKTNVCFETTIHCTFQKGPIF